MQYEGEKSCAEPRNNQGAKWLKDQDFIYDSISDMTRDTLKLIKDRIGALVWGSLTFFFNVIIFLASATALTLYLYVVQCCIILEIISTDFKTILHLDFITHYIPFQEDGGKKKTMLKC